MGVRRAPCFLWPIGQGSVPVVFFLIINVVSGTLWFFLAAFKLVAEVTFIALLTASDISPCCDVWWLCGELLRTLSSHASMLVWSYVWSHSIRMVLCETLWLLFIFSPCNGLDWPLTGCCSAIKVSSGSIMSHANVSRLCSYDWLLGHLPSAGHSALPADLSSRSRRTVSDPGPQHGAGSLTRKAPRSSRCFCPPAASFAGLP